MATAKQLREALEMALEWIDAVPSDVVASLSAMPGFDRDYVDGLIAEAKTEDAPEIDTENRSMVVPDDFNGYCVEYWNSKTGAKAYLLFASAISLGSYGFTEFPSVSTLVETIEASGGIVGSICDIDRKDLYDNRLKMAEAQAKADELLLTNFPVPVDFNGYHVTFWDHETRDIEEHHFPNGIDILKRGFTEDGFPDAETFAEDLYEIFGDRVGTIKDNDGKVLLDRHTEMMKWAKEIY